MKKGRNKLKITSLLLAIIMVLSLLPVLSLTAFAADGDACAVTDCSGTYTNGICSVCDDYEPATDLDNDGYYEIGNAGQLYWFAAEVNGGNGSINGKLTADIDLESRIWYPIGVYDDAVDANGTTVQIAYKGTIDGNYYTVSNFTATGNGSQGLVGYTTDTAVVKNLGVVNATVSGWNAGAVLAYYGTVENCYAIDCTITAYTTQIASGVYAGSVAGTQQAIVKNCFAYNCEVIAGEGMESKAMIAPVGGKTAENCYYGKVTATNGAFRTSSGETEKTAAQFTSGEVAYLLRSAFGQTLEGENRQDYPVLGGEVAPDTNAYLYGQQLNLGADLAMKFYVSAYSYAGDLPFLQEDELVLKVLFLGKWHELTPTKDETTKLYVFTLDEIDPQCMGDTMEIKLYYQDDLYDEMEYSVEQNLKNLLADHPDDTYLKTLIYDLLAYGEAAEEYIGHNSMKPEQPYVGSHREIPASEIEVTGENILGYTVNFGVRNYIKIQFDLTAEQYSDGLFVVKANDEGASSVGSIKTGYYKSPDLCATDFDTVFTFKSTRVNATTVIDSISISVNDYLYAITQRSANENMVKLAKALYNYGVSAEEYAASQTN